MVHRDESECLPQRLLHWRYKPRAARLVLAETVRAQRSLGQLSLPVVGYLAASIILGLELYLSGIKHRPSLLQVVHLVDTGPLDRVLQILDALQPLILHLLLVLPRLVWILL